MFQYETIKAILPEQGSVELQRDQPGKLHDWHSHDTDETLFILEGGLSVQIEDDGAITEFMVKPGDDISLPKGTKHRSTASEEGAIYAIAFRLFYLEDVT